MFITELRLLHLWVKSSPVLLGCLGNNNLNLSFERCIMVIKRLFFRFQVHVFKQPLHLLAGECALCQIMYSLAGLFWRNDLSCASVIPSEQTASSYIMGPSRLTGKGTKWHFFGNPVFYTKSCSALSEIQQKISKKSSVVTEIQLFEYYRFGGNRIRLKTWIVYFSIFGRMPIIGTFSREPARSLYIMHTPLLTGAAVVRKRMHLNTKKILLINNTAFEWAGSGSCCLNNQACLGWNWPTSVALAILF